MRIFDVIRKKYVHLTPEEWVRQNIVMYLNEGKNYPLQLMSIETRQKGKTLKGRTDIVLHNQLGKAVMIVECKAPGVKLDNSTFEQAAAYNLSLKVDYLMITNGRKHYCCRLDHEKKSWEFLKGIPDYCEVKNW